MTFRAAFLALISVLAKVSARGCFRSFHGGGKARKSLLRSGSQFCLVVMAISASYYKGGHEDVCN